MDFQLRIVCPENEELASFMTNKWQEMAQNPKGISDNLNNNFHRAYSNLCNSKTPIKSLRDLSEIRGVGKWILKLMQGFFNTDSGASENDDITKKGKRNNSTRRYVPQKHSVAYALLVTLHRGTENGSEFMRRQELIDAAEASGLSRVPIAPEKGKGKLGKFGSSPREWYSGWSCMKTLITKGLVVKSSCPAKYMLTEEGKEVAQECLSRSGLVDCNNKSDIVQIMSCLEPEDLDLSERDMPDLARDLASSSNEVAFPSFPSNIQKKSIDVLPESLDRDKEGREALESKFNALAMPPLDFGECFEDAYAVILVLDDREQFASQGSRSRKIIDNISSQFKTQIEVRRLPVGDAIWIAHHKCTGSEYVLDFVVERKKVDDLRMSIRDNRYKDQKLRLLRCGLKKVIYLVEGDPNSCEAAESIKTACFTTEIMEGFDVQRTSGLADTLRKYGYLTQAIKQYYKSLDSKQKSSRICPQYGEFIRRCEDLDKMTVSDVFAIQLMQVPQVTEEVVIAVLEMYPTLLSLARAYSVLDGDICAQEEMLKRQSNNLISGAASRNIFQLIWGS